MNKLQSKRMISLAIGSLVCAVLFSFSPRLGGDSFSIYLNKKLLFQQYVYNHDGLKTVSLANATEKDVLNVHYSHCGSIGNNRSIAIKDSQNKILKEWRFPDVAKGSEGEMSCQVRDILALQKANKGRVNLVYASRELPEGKTLATIELPDGVKASLK
jgi:hypothetical protein